MNIRKSFQNHLLPSEAAAIFRSLLGSKLHSAYFGLLATQSDKHAISNAVHLVFDNSSAVEFRLDDLSGSLAVMLHEGVLSHDQLLDSVRRTESILPRFFRTDKLSKFGVNAESKAVASVSVFKLPDNLGVKNGNIRILNELITAFNFENGYEILVAIRVNDVTSGSPQLTTWDSFSDSFPKSLLREMTITDSAHAEVKFVSPDRANDNT